MMLRCYLLGEGRDSVTHFISLSKVYLLRKLCVDFREILGRIALRVIY